MANQLSLFAASYSSTSAAVDDLHTIEQLHKDKFVGFYDAAVIDKENGKPHIRKRVDRPRMQAIPEMFGGGKLPRKELKEAASQLTDTEVGLIVVGEPTIEKGVDTALKGAVKVMKRSVDATTDEIAEELQAALKD